MQTSFVPDSYVFFAYVCSHLVPRMQSQLAIVGKTDDKEMIYINIFNEILLYKYQNIFTWHVVAGKVRSTAVCPADLR